MKKGKASWTAQITAIFRATESIRPPQKRLLNDTFAAQFLKPILHTVLKIPFLAKFLLWIAIERRFPGATVTIVSRIRFVDDSLKKCIQDGVEQVVILGAGYDSRAYRFQELKTKHVFEVDHPDTQKEKIEKIRNIFSHMPSYVTYVPVDFETDNLMEKLNSAGYNREKKTLFIWEGVCKYLTPNAVYELLTVVSRNSCKGSSIVFDYLFQSMIDGTSGSFLARKILDFQTKKGEPYIFGLPDENPGQVILEKGYSLVKNITAAKLKKMYFSKTSRAKKLHPFWGIIQAIV